MKRIKILIGLTSLLLLFSGSALAQPATGKIGYVDLSYVFDEYGKTKDYDKVLAGKHADYEKDRNAKLDKIKENQQKLGLLKEEEKAKLEAQIEEQRNELLEYDRQQQTELKKQRDEKIREILLEVEKVVSDFAQKENYSIILNDRVLIYGSDTYNVTDQVLKVLNKDYPAATKTQ